MHNRVSPEVAAAQAEYAARPWIAYLNTSHMSSAQRFHTEGEAIDYLFRGYEMTRRNIREWRARGDRCWIGYDARRSYLEGPDGAKIQARFVLMAESISDTAR